MKHPKEQQLKFFIFRNSLKQNPRSPAPPPAASPPTDDNGAGNSGHGDINKLPGKEGLSKNLLKNKV